jgi:hypothetical protein
VRQSLLSYLALVRGQAVVALMSFSGGAFLQSHAKAMTDRKAGATVCESGEKVPGDGLLSASVIAPFSASVSVHQSE